LRRLLLAWHRMWQECARFHGGVIVERSAVRKTGDEVDRTLAAPTRAPKGSPRISRRV